MCTGGGGDKVGAADSAFDPWLLIALEHPSSTHEFLYALSVRPAFISR
jgi:hypothetical protein